MHFICILLIAYCITGSEETFVFGVIKWSFKRAGGYTYSARGGFGGQGGIIGGKKICANLCKSVVKILKGNWAALRFVRRNHAGGSVAKEGHWFNYSILSLTHVAALLLKLLTLNR